MLAYGSTLRAGSRRASRAGFLADAPENANALDPDERYRHHLSRVDRREQLLAVANEAQSRIDDALGRVAPSEIKGTKFDQVGLHDGFKIVEDYIRVGELGAAFDHLLYMVIETDISLTPSSVLFLERTAAALGLPAPRIPVAR